VNILSNQSQITRSGHSALGLTLHCKVLGCYSVLESLKYRHIL